MIIKVVKRSAPRRVFLLRQVAWFAACCCAISVAHGQAMPWRTTVWLKGQSSGGVLSLGEALSVNSPYVLVTNQPGDKAEAVLKRLAVQLAGAAAAFNGKRVDQVADRSEEGRVGKEG